MPLFQPSNQIKLTNVAVVRYKHHGKRFEIACYKNKILNWRSGVEWDLDEVLQIRSIFTNVSRGQIASSDDLVSVFGTSDNDIICKIILNNGQIQISENEREYMLEKRYTDICHMLTQMTINPENNLPLSTKIIESELKKSGFSVSLNKSTKEQALKAFEILKRRIPNQIERLKMIIKLSTAANNKEKLLNQILEFDISIISTDEDNEKFSVVFFCDPCHYRKIDSLNYQLLLLDSNVNLPDNNLIFSQGKPSKNPLVLNNEYKELKLSTEKITREKKTFVEEKTDKDVFNCEPIPNVVQKRVFTKLNSRNNQKSEILICQKCKVEFSDSNLFRKHYQSDWHIFNTKRIVREMEPISEKEFIELQQDIKMGFLAIE